MQKNLKGSKKYLGQISICDMHMLLLMHTELNQVHKTKFKSDLAV